MANLSTALNLLTGGLPNSNGASSASTPDHRVENNIAITTSPVISGVFDYRNEFELAAQ